MNTHLVTGPVVVGVDGSESAYRAVRWAAREVRRRGARLRLVHAFAWSDAENVAEVFNSGEYRDMLMAVARDDLVEATRLASAQVPAASIEAMVVGGQPESVLCAEAERARMLVIGTRGRGGLAGLLLGSVAASVATRAVCPVVVVRGIRLEGDPSVRPVVVGVDDAPDTDTVIAFAHEAASANAAPLIAVAVHTWQSVLVDSPVAPLPDRQAIHAAERKIIAQRLADWGQKYPNVSVELVVGQSRPAQTLVDLSENASLVVVAGRGGRSELSSVCHALLLRATCPVAVVPQGAAGAQGAD